MTAIDRADLQLFCGTASGFSRKVRIVALELGLAERIEPIFVAPQKDVGRLAPLNPMGKVPVLVHGERAIYDSTVICEYLCRLAGDRLLLPHEGDARFEVLVAAALGDGTLEAGMLARAEAARDPRGEGSAWQDDKLARCLDAIETSPRLRRDPLAGAIDLGDIAIGAALGWLGFRLKERDLLGSRPVARTWFDTLSQRASFQATMPAA